MNLPGLHLLFFFLKTRYAERHARSCFLWSKWISGRYLCACDGGPATTWLFCCWSLLSATDCPHTCHIFVAHAWQPGVQRDIVYIARLALSLSIRLNRALILIGHDCYPAMLPSLEAGRKDWRDMRDMLVASVEHQAQQTSGMYMLSQAIHYMAKITETFILI